MAGQRPRGAAGGAGSDCRRQLCPSWAWGAGSRQRPCPARLQSCDGRGCRWAWRSWGAAAVRRSEVPRDSEGNVLTICLSPEPALSRPRGHYAAHEDAVAQAAAQYAELESRGRKRQHLQDIRKQNHLSIWPWNLTYVTFPEQELFS